jgi:hypothetical protein
VTWWESACAACVDAADDDDPALEDVREFFETVDDVAAAEKERDAVPRSATPTPTLTPKNPQQRRSATPCRREQWSEPFRPNPALVGPPAALTEPMRARAEYAQARERAKVAAAANAAAARAAAPPAAPKKLDDSNIEWEGDWS